ncbi:hypothetical protein ACSBR2_026148 [Camellia fascicularis]
MLVSREVLLVLFPNLLDLQSTQDSDGVRTEPVGIVNELENAKLRIIDLEREIKTKSTRVRELEHQVKSMEELLRVQATNIFIGFDSVIVRKDTEIARHTKMVDQLNATVTNLEDSLDDREAPDVMQMVANDRSNQQKPSNSRARDGNRSDNVTSGGSVHQSSSIVGRTNSVVIPA